MPTLGPAPFESVGQILKCRSHVGELDDTIELGDDLTASGEIRNRLDVLTAFDRRNHPEAAAAEHRPEHPAQHATGESPIGVDADERDRAAWSERPTEVPHGSIASDVDDQVVALCAVERVDFWSSYATTRPAPIASTMSALAPLYTAVTVAPMERRAAPRTRRLRRTRRGRAVLDAYVYGFVLQEVSLAFDGPDDLRELAEEILVQIRVDEYPSFVEFAREHVLQPGYDFGKEFEVGLAMVLRLSISSRSAAVGSSDRRPSSASSWRTHSRKVSDGSPRIAGDMSDRAAGLHDQPGAAVQQLGRVPPCSESPTEPAWRIIAAAAATRRVGASSAGAGRPMVVLRQLCSWNPTRNECKPSAGCRRWRGSPPP